MIMCNISESANQYLSCIKNSYVLCNQLETISKINLNTTIAWWYVTMLELGYVKFWYYRKWWTVRLTVTLPVLPTLKVQKQRNTNSSHLWRPKNLLQQVQRSQPLIWGRLDSFFGNRIFKVGITDSIPQSSYKWISCVVIFQNQI